MNAQDIPSCALNWLGEINPFTQPQEDHAYTQLAHSVRHGRDQLPAGLLLPGDTVEVEGFVLIIENVICSARSVALHFIEPSDWMLCLGRDKRVRVISKVERFTPTGRGRLTLDDVLDPRN
jgi:hypothetical protein